MYLPVFFNLKKKRILVVGGGRVARQKLKTILLFSKNVTVAAPQILRAIRNSRVTCLSRKYGRDLLQGFHLVYACTNDCELNRQIKRDAARLHILVNVADDKKLCNFISPAVFKHKTMTVAVCSGGTNPAKSARWRDAIKEFLTHALRHC